MCQTSRANTAVADSHPTPETPAMLRFLRALALLILLPLSLAAQSAPLSYAQLRSAPFPNELVAASGVDRIAWALNDNGKRNLWTASHPRSHHNS